MPTKAEPRTPDPDSSAVRGGTRLLTRRQVAGLLGLDDCIAAVEAAFLAHAEGHAVPPGVLGVHVQGGGFHIKTAGLAGPPAYFAAKLNGNFYGNAEHYGMPRIQGLIVLSDARNGYPLAVMDSTLITVVRTGAATAVAAKYLALPEAESVTLCGCGLQGRIQLAAIRRVRPIKKVYAVDTDPAAAQRLARGLQDEIEVVVLAADRLSLGTRCSGICVTCTPSQRPFLGVRDIAPGAFVAAVGADSAEKQELDAELLRASRVVVDHLEQCASIGELHHALARNLLSRADVHAQLHEIVAGQRPGRSSPDEIFVFDSTGVALEDVAAAVLVYERAVATGTGQSVGLLD